MLIQIILFLLIGVFAGTLTGLIPGIHINLIGAILISLTASIYINPIYSITFVTSMAITHTFVDFIPSIFLGCSDTDTELSILPGHELLKDKRGYEAINLANKGSLIAIFLTIILIVPSFLFLEKSYSLIQNFIPYLLILISLILIFTEKKKFLGFFVLIFTGLLGFSVNTLEINQPLLPLLTGLFGASNIIISLKNKTQIPKQIISKSKVSIKRPIIGGILTAPICSFLPGMGGGQAAIIANTLKRNSKKQFLVLLGIINTLVMSFSFISLYLIQKTRTGAALAINEISNELNIEHIILIISIIIISGILAFFITDILSKYFAIKFEKINYKFLSISTLIILAIIVLIVSKGIGLIVLVISTLTGIYCIELKVRRTQMMGVLIIPTIIWLLGG
ncbi:hypothetical protein GW932_04315 [archaeon]|nr:hypothetical protein [archaeon]